MIERAFQIAEGNVGINRESLDLVKHWRVAGVGRIVTVYFAGNHDAQGRLNFLHCANLYRRRMRAQ